GAIPWYLESEVVDIITLIAQCFFGYQLLLISRYKIIPISVVTVELYASSPLRYVVGSVVQGLCFLFYYSRGVERPNKSTGVVVDNLILYTVTRGTATAICQLMFMELVLSFPLPHDTFWQPFHQAGGKLYVNSVLATLNFRETSTK
ncbi:hypothetical protein C8J57DRAFT_1276094, partial [Mycena rebaudengoi]